ncbi:MAG: protease pro-enzyme activation domain-containing protein, partial [Bryobacteraceae bacterium]
MRLALRSSCLFLAAWAACAQQDRITGPIDTTRTAVLNGNRSSRALPPYDRGPVDPGQLINGVTLVFMRTASQQAALDQLLAQQQDPTSPNYHNWLTPEQFSDRFGLSSVDLAKVTGWLQSQGFSVAYEARSRTYVTSSGTAAQVQAAFHTELHRYQVDGETHFANSSDPSIPTALEPVVLVIQGLDDFRPKAPVHQFSPNYTANGTHSLVPGDIATIYDINPIYSAGITGGVPIAVIGQSNINLSDIATFRSSIGLSNNPPQMVLVKGSADPGIVKGDQGESTLDLEYAGGIAQNASILFVYSTSVVTSEEYAIDQNLAPVMTLSYGECEPAISSSPSSATAYRSFAQQANAQGITWTASTGDTGAAECDNGVQIATHGLAVEIPSSIPEVTAVGGTEFNEGANLSQYWSATNNSTTKASALGYIPEIAWNDTQLSIANGGTLSATGGGASIFFPKPAWQAGTGVPNDGARDVPDVAFSASDYHDPYYVYLNGAATFTTGGTSVSTPIFAGVVSLLNQYLINNHVQSQPGLGNINPTLYSLAATPTNNVFHDILSGSNNIVPCQYGTPNCPGTTMGYSTGPGYDLVTGWGSADINNLFTHWPGLPGQGAGATATTTTVSANPTTILISGTTVVTVNVTAASGSVAPNGSVSFNAGTKNLGTATLTGSGSVGSASLKVYGSQLAAGANIITVSYGGSTNFKYSSGSVTVTVTVSTTASAVIPSVVPNPVYQQAVTGCPFAFTVILTEIAGVPTTLTDFTFGGNDYATSIPTFFGTANMPAHGTLSAALCATVQTVPTTLTLGFSGQDASGQTWTQQIVVPFYPAQVSASMALASLPGTEVENPKGDPNCSSDYPFFQELDLQEQNGYEVYLTKFLAGGNDLSSGIAGWFGSLRLAPLGALQAGICWQLNSTPATLTYEIDGVDTGGNTITTTASVVFNLPATQSGGTLAASKNSVSLNVAAGGSATTSVGVNIASGQTWSASLFPNNQKTSWLVVYPQSGTGPGTVNLVATGGSLAPGAYIATLVIQSVNTIPQFVNVPITFTIGASGNMSISSISNSFSYSVAF